MSDENNLISPERRAEIERRMQDWNKAQSFSVVKPTSNTPIAKPDAESPSSKADAPKGLGW